MLKDAYLENCKRKYAVKAGNLLGKNWKTDYLEMGFELLELNEKEKLISLLKTALEDELKLISSNDQSVEPKNIDTNEEELACHSKIKTFILQRSAGQNKRQVSIDSEWIERATEELKINKFNQRRWVGQFEEIFEFLPHFFENYKSIQKEIFEQNQTVPRDLTEYQLRLSEFSAVFKVNSKEMDVVTFLFLIRTDSTIDDFLGGRDINLLNLSKSTRYFCRFFDLEPGDLRKMFSKDSILIKAGIIQQPSYRSSRRDNSIELSEIVVSFLSGISEQTLESEYVKMISLDDVLSLEDHNISDEKKNIFKNLLSIEKGCNILLYGHPGTGKTEFAKSLAQETGKEIYFINQSDNAGDEDLDFRKQAIIAAHNIISPENSIIVVDECDTILNIYDGFWKCETEKSQDRKAWINEFLDTASHKIIWISNKVQGIDDSTKRRFSYSLEFHPLSYLQRKKVWETQIKKQGIDFMGKEDVELMARELKVNSGGITLALRDVNEMKGPQTDEAKREILTSILRQHKCFTEEESIGLIKKTSKYSLDIVNSNYPLEKLLQTADDFLRTPDQFNRVGIYNLNILLQGAPGTGKTEFVKHLAEVTDKELIIKRASDIRSKWYGESVKNIAQSFKEAQENGSILFFDEADSFFSSRETASTHHAEETNEFLTQMENFQGVLLCATNFTDRLDQASMRRFNHKVKFDYLSTEAKKKLFLSFFGDHLLAVPQESTWADLERIPGLTPGDFKIVYQRNAFTKRSPSELILELEEEVRYKKAFSKKVGLS